MVVTDAGVALSQDVLTAAERLGALPDLAKVVELTRSLFGDLPAVRVVEDPEISDWVHLVLDVRVTGTVEEVLEKEDRWQDALDAMGSVNSRRLFCLAVHV